MAHGEPTSSLSGERPRLLDITSKYVNKASSRSSMKNSRDAPDSYSYPSNSKHNFLQVPQEVIQYPSGIENKHLSTVADGRRDSKRESQLSVSTNSSVPLWGDRKRKTHIGPWLLGRTLGKGATCRVRKAKHDVTDQEAAVKIVSRHAAFGQRSESVMAMDKLLANDPRWAQEKRVPFGIEREIVIMKLIEHPNIIRLYDVWENRGEMYLVLELVEGGELFDHILNNGALPEAEAVRFFRQILAGIGHCHRFRLCHRDLKPENILLDSKGNIKIADFGMASMQHAEWLETSCGSPHYAAPEIAQGLRYEGEKADIWSMGVVLYVLLTGTVPFGATIDTNNPKTRNAQVKIILNEVIHKDVTIPKWICAEAEDLLLYLLNKDPSQRPSIEEIWGHALIQKHGGYVKHPQGPNKWSEGPEPQLTEADCGPPIRDISQVDLDIVASLCVLWHTADQEGIVKSLLSSEHNYEQIFYHRLLRYREEQEENFQGSGVGISTSDYHHVDRARLRKFNTKTALSVVVQKRQRSQFSIAPDPRRKRSSHTRRTVSVADTEQSYDPFRSSRSQMPIVTAATTTVTVLRSPSRTKGSYSTRTPSLAVEDWSSTNFLSSPPQGRPIDANGRTRDLRHTVLSRGYSRSSMGSSMYSQNSSRRGRRSASYKRGVSFVHLKRRSSGRASPPPRPRAPSPLNMLQSHQQNETTARPDHKQRSNTTETGIHLPMVKSREEGGQETGDENITRSSNRYSAYLTQEARHVSRELEQYCDDAFRDSHVELSPRDFSKAPSAALQQGKAGASSTPVPPPRKSSVNQATGRSLLLNDDACRQFPFPDPPTVPSLANDALQKLLNAQAALVAKASSMPPDDLKRSLAAINKMLQTAREDVKREEARRTASAPARHTTSSKLRSLRHDEWTEPRHVSEPTPGQYSTGATSKSYGWGSAQATIRIVHQNDLKPAPLAVRKKPNGVSPTSSYTDSTREQQYPNQHPSIGISNVHPSQKGWPLEDIRHSGFDQLDTPLETIAEDGKESNPSASSQRGSKEAKFKNLFRRSSSSRSSSDSDCGPPPPAKDLKPFKDNRDARPFKPTAGRFPIDTISDDFEFQDALTDKAPRKKGFLSFLGWKSAKPNHPELTVFEDDSSSSSAHPGNKSTLSVSKTSKGAKAVNFNDTTSKPPSRLPRSLTAGPQSWLARFLHVKPASRVMALQMSRPAALKEVRGILRDWKRHGMRDVVSDRGAGRLSARVDAENSLRIKPVSIAVEFFTVLLRGRRNDLCVARFVQERGARTSFARVVRTAEDVLRGRGLLVTEKKKASEMRACLKRWESG